MVERKKTKRNGKLEREKARERVSWRKMAKEKREKESSEKRRLEGWI